MDNRIHKRVENNNISTKHISDISNISIKEYIKNLEVLKSLTSDLLTEYKVKNRLVEQSFVVCDKCEIK